MHTHPWFSAANWAEEMRRELGCGGSRNAPIVFSEYILMYGWQTVGEGTQFSSGDRSATIAVGKPGYMRVPAGNVIKKLMPDMTETQVYP